MTARRSSSESDLLRAVADSYRQQGFRVRVEPPPSSLPPELRALKIDLVASRGDENIVVEVKSGAKSGSVSGQLGQLTALANGIGWRVDLVSEPEPEGSLWSRARRESLLRSALDLLDEGHKEACLLLANAAVEGALASLAGKHRSLSDRLVPARQLIASLVSYGVIGERTSERLARLSEARNHVAHGRSMGRFSIDDIRESVADALWLNATDFVTPDEMVDWFFTYYEDPAQWVPYETREGGYQYPPGEPHDARDVLLEEYPLAPMDALDDAVDLVEPLGVEWVEKRDVPA